MSNQLSYNERITICQGCEHYSSIGTCGTPVIGNVVTHNGQEMKLCGCFMKIKAGIPMLSCPLDKWKGFISESERIELFEVLKKAKETGVIDIQTIARWWNKTHPGQNQKASTCTRCNVAMIDELWMKVKDRTPH